MMRGLMLAIVIAIVPLTMLGCDCGKCRGDDTMAKPKAFWATVPGGQVWLNPGDAYEWETKLVRDRFGAKRYPTTPGQVAPQPSYPVYQPQPSYAPAPQPYYAPARPPYYAPAPQPLYQPPTYAPAPYDYGPYVPARPNCPNCPLRPSSHAWGVSSYDPMDVPKTGDAPRR